MADERVSRLTEAAHRPASLRTGVTPLRLALTLLGILGVLAAMLLSAQQMSDLRVALPPLSQAMNWLEMLPLPLDMDHVVFFALVACTLRLVLPGVRAGWLLVALCALAVGTELLQVMTDGRTPKVQDARDDLLGACIGLLVGSLPLWAAQRSRTVLQLADIALLVGILLLPLQQWSPFAALGFPLMLSDLIFVIALGLRGFAWLGGRAPLPMSGFHVWLAAYVLAMLLAVLVLWPACASPGLQGFPCIVQSPHLMGAVSKWLGVVYLALVAVMACDAIQRGHMLKHAVSAWLIAGLLAALLSMVAVLAFYLTPEAEGLKELLNHYGSLPPGEYPRVRSTFRYASMFCSFMTVSVALLLAAREAGWMSLQLFAFALACMLLGSLPTLTPELGAMALVLGVSAQCALRESAPRLGRALLIGGLLLAALMLLVATRSLLEPLEVPSQRWQLWQQAWGSVLAQPWRGVGLGRPVAGLAYLDPSGGMQWLTDAHNVWLNVTGQAGLPALVALAGLCGWLVLQGARCARISGGLAGGLLMGFVAAFLYSGLTGSFEDARHVWVLMGLLAGSCMACAGVISPPACDDAAPAAP